jgi:hypothetical protein
LAVYVNIVRLLMSYGKVMFFKRINGKSQLNGYIQYFDEIFTESEAENIFNFLNNEGY